MSIKTRIKCSMNGSQGWLWTGVGLAIIAVGLMVATQWLMHTQAALGTTLAFMVYTAWAQAFALASMGVGGVVMLKRAVTVCHGHESL
jgi:hypothetical protein